MQVEKQVAIIYVGTQGLLDTVDVKYVRRFEEEFHAMLEQKHPEIMTSIAQTGALADDVAAKLKEVAVKFIAAFKEKNRA